jgi:hypothetical protein
MSRYLLLTLALLLIVSIDITAQPKNANKAKPNAADAAKDLEAERLLKERRENAEALLISLAVDARNFNDATLRARTQARIADSLWKVDRERSRSLFRAAWDAAEAADAESQRRVQEDIRQQQAKTGSGGYVIASPPDLRREVLGLAGKHDRALGEELLAKFKEQKTREATEAKSRNPSGFDEATGQRLSLARELVGAGDIERALQFADPVLSSISMQSVDFLAYLREKDSAAADQRYAAMLASTPLNPQSDANTISLLSSYIFTPHFYVVFHGNGASTSQMSGTKNPNNVSPEVIATFFRTAAVILLKPIPPPGQDQTSTGPDGQYLIIKRLLPLFEQLAPQEMTTALKAQLQALSSIASSNARERDDEWLNRGIGPEKTDKPDREQALLDRIDRAKTSAERDQLNLELAYFLVSKNDLSARERVEKIDEMELRQSAKAYIDSALAVRAIEKKDATRALEIVRIGELSHFHKSWLLSQTAKILAKTDREQALALIEDAAQEARRMENSDPDRPRAFFAIANVIFSLNGQGVWEVMSDAIKASNSAEQFSGEDGQLTFRLISKGMRSVNQSPFPDFDVAGIFGKLTDENYDRAVELARGFQREAPRASATIAIARAILEEKKK